MRPPHHAITGSPGAPLLPEDAAVHIGVEVWRATQSAVQCSQVCLVITRFGADSSRA